MSRPPRPHSARSTGASRTDAQDRLDYLPLEYADLLDLQRRVAVRALGRVTDQGADVADTLMQLSALVGHVLAVYQRQFAREAFISTAQAPSSLLRHAQRLGGEPDPGLAASGHVVLFTKPGVAGSVAAGLPLATVPVGEDRAQDYETDAAVTVDAALNDLRPVAATRAQTLAAADRQLRVVGVGHGFAPGDEVAVVAPGFHVGLTVESVEEVADVGGQTVLHLRQGLGLARTVGAGETDPPLVLADPAVRPRSFGAGADAELFPGGKLRDAAGSEPKTGVGVWGGITGVEGGADPAVRPRSFGAGADAELFPGGKLRDATGSEPKTGVGFWYEISSFEGGTYRDDEIYLDVELTASVLGDWVMHPAGRSRVVYRVVDERLVSVVLNRAEAVDVTPDVVRLVPQEGGGFVTVVEKPSERQSATRAAHLSGTVTALRLETSGGKPVLRRQQGFEGAWSTGWQVRAPLAGAVPNPEPLTEPLVLPGVHPALAPGRPVVFADPHTGEAQVVRLRRVELEPVSGTTRIEWDALTSDPPTPWTLDRLVVHGNVAPVSHGRTVRERLPVSDGVSAYQVRPLREAPLTHLPGTGGGEPQLEVRVAGVRWTRVDDFAESGPDDRHYRLVAAADGTTSVQFGDGRAGAVPPAGALMDAAYRIGRGTEGNAGAGRLSRVKRAHPLLDHVVNLTPISGGAEPAAPADVRAQATRWIRTFDRAVSVADLADLALTMPGVARASAYWAQQEGVVLVVATRDGEPPPVLSAVRAFLDARRDATVPLTLRGPAPRDVEVAVLVEADPDWLPEVVEAGVRAELLGHFSFPAQQLGQPGYLSEVTALVDALPGVVAVRVSRFAAVDNTGVADAVTPGPAGWLRLQPQHLGVTITGPVR